jgi:hypothetical protein
MELTDKSSLVAELVVVLIEADGLHGCMDETLHHTVVSMSSKERSPEIINEILLKCWGLGLDAAHHMLMA